MLLYYRIIILTLVCLLSSSYLFGGLGVDIETGYLSTGYNNVRIPGDTGTRFSLSEDLKAEQITFYRVRLNYHIGRKHTFSALFAPLTINSDGQLSEDVHFQDVLFPAMTDLQTNYRFDSYRFTYRYRFVDRERFQLGLGITAKLRDAEIGLESATDLAVKDNTGYVPLVNFRMNVGLKERWHFLLMGDALAAPQGRAEDVLAALTYSPSNLMCFKLGYRILEGGADNDEVYTFSLFNYAVVGLILQW